MEGMPEGPLQGSSLDAGKGPVLVLDASGLVLPWFVPAVPRYGLGENRCELKTKSRRPSRIFYRFFLCTCEPEPLSLKSIAGLWSRCALVYWLSCSARERRSSFQLWKTGLFAPSPPVLTPQWLSEANTVWCPCRHSPPWSGTCYPGSCRGVRGIS